MSTTIELNDSQIEALTKTKECITLLDYGTEVPADIMLNFLEKKSEATQNECALALGYKDDAKVLLKTLRDMTTPPSPVDTPPKSDAVVPPPGDNSGLVEKAT